MSDRTLHLTLTTPMRLLVDAPGVTALRAEDETGSFGILPGHDDFLTVLPASVLRWHGRDGVPQFCALRGGVLSVSGGTRVSVACRQATLGADLGALEAEVAHLRADEADADRRARAEQMRLHTNAVRQMMRYLRPGAISALDHPTSGPAATMQAEDSA
ncbi:MAG: F0F1 ATP synthase subunit epsilon [Paracoccaceae bacterium]|jgi:F-type H+-transporting ATPase subunit epsilon|nr:F0F1 ATP synthase subunit epsilon [Paracoccaceae bacterium]